jgi:hypothetical protein
MASRTSDPLDIKRLIGNKSLSYGTRIVKLTDGNLQHRVTQKYVTSIGVCEFPSFSLSEKKMR